MAGLQDLLEAYRNYRGTQEWKLGKQEEQMLGGDPQAMGLWEKLQGFGPADMGGIAGAIKTYHGTPNPTPFTKFHRNFIGQGEGTQLESISHYLTEQPKAAKYYSEMAGDMYDMRFSDPSYEKLSHAVRLALHPAAHKYDDPVKGFKETLKYFQRQHSDAVKYDMPDLANEVQGHIDELNTYGLDILKSKYVAGPLHSIYETSLEWPGARESTDPMSREHFFQWNNSLKNQPEHVQQAFSDIRKSDRALLPSTNINEIRKILSGDTDIPRGTLEQALHDRGIPGVAYKGGMNTDPVPTFNYVSFDDEYPRILSHNKPSLMQMLWPKFNK